MNHAITENSLGKTGSTAVVLYMHLTNKYCLNSWEFIFVPLPCSRIHSEVHSTQS